MEESIRRFLTREELAVAAYGRLTGAALAGLALGGSAPDLN